MAGTTSEWFSLPPGRWELLLQSKVRITKAQYLFTMLCNPFARASTGKRSEKSWKWKRSIVLHWLLGKPQIQKQKSSKNPFIFFPLPTRMSFLHHTYKFNKEMGSGISFHISASYVWLQCIKLRNAENLLSLQSAYFRRPRNRID